MVRRLRGQVRIFGVDYNDRRMPCPVNR